MITFSKNFKDKQKTFGLYPAQLVFADLVFMGYKDTDAYILSGLYRGSETDYKNTKAMTQLLESDSFKSYQRTLQKQKSSEIREEVNRAKATQGTSNGAVSLDKESAISTLENLLPDLEGKEKADVILKIADLRGWKKEQIKDEEELVKYHLPLGCNNCSLYMDAKRKGKG